MENVYEAYSKKYLQKGGAVSILYKVIGIIFVIAGIILFGFGCRPSEIIYFCWGIKEKASTADTNIYCKFEGPNSAVLKKNGDKFVINEKKELIKKKKTNGFEIDDNYIAELVKLKGNEHIPKIFWGLRIGGIAAFVIGCSILFCKKYGC